MMKRTLFALSIATLSMAGLAGLAGLLSLPVRAQTATATPQPTATPTSAATPVAASPQSEASATGGSSGQTPLRTITVIGIGRATAAPDIARVILGVDAVQSTLGPAVTEVNSKTADIIAAVKEAGIDAKDIQTFGFSIYPQQNFGPSGPGPITGYRVSNTVRVTVRDLEKVAPILEAAINAGANNIQGLNFSIDDPAPVEAEARVKAVADAKAKADALAREASVTVKRVISISEVITGSPMPLPAPVLASAAEGRGGGVSIEPGSRDVFVQIQVVYELE